MKRLAVVVTVALMAVMFSSTGFAQSWADRRQAQKLGAQARYLLKAGKFKEAAKKYKKADSLYPAPHYKVEMAKLLVELEDFVQAGQILEQAADSKPRRWSERKAIKAAQRLLVEVEERTPTIAVAVIKPRTADATITIEGETYDSAEGPIRLNPGRYEVVVVAPGYDDWTKTVKLRETDRKELDVTLRKAGPAPEEEDSSGEFSAVPAYVSWGVGVVGLGIGIPFGIMAIQSTNDVLNKYNCQDSKCPPEARDDLDTALLNGNISTAGFIVGSAGIAVGTVLFIVHATSGGDDDESLEDDDQDDGDMLSIEAKPLIGPGYIGVHGTF